MAYNPNIEVRTRLMITKKSSIPRENEAFEKSIPKWAYLVGLIVIYVSIYAQYFLGDLDTLVLVFVVYGIPVITVSLLWGRPIIRRALNNSFSALKYGLGMFGAFMDLAMILSIVIVIALFAFDPSAIDILNQPNPVLEIPPEAAWIMVWVSIMVVGPVEEYLFRGFVFGGLLAIFRNRHWLVLAFASSVLFASVHLYYALVYGVASLVMFTILITLGMAMAATYYLSGGNLIIPALIHGVYDAAGFLTIAVSVETGIFLREAMIGIGTIVAIGLFIQTIRQRRTAPVSTLKPKFCIYCGQSLPEDAVFCPNCGRKQDWIRQ
jgi:membrane protease YdiL (CAAX protease family)